MKKYRRLFAGIFAAGVLISGVGFGIGFTEFVSLEYIGERIVGETEMAVLEGDMTFTPLSGEERISVYTDYGYHALNMVWDAAVPKDTLSYKITYNKKVIQPEVWQHEKEMGFYFTDTSNDDLKDVMEFRNMILGDLKEHKIGSYKKKSLESVEIHLNPENKNNIEIW